MDHAPAPRRLQIVLVEDSPLLRGLLAGILGELEGVEVVGMAADEAAALGVLQEHPADLAIVDLDLARGSGLGVLRALQRHPERYGPPRAVVFSNYGHPHLRDYCRTLGVARYFDKSLQLADLIDYVQAISGAHCEPR